MIALASQDAGGYSVVGAHRQGPAPDLHFLAVRNVGLERILGGEHAVRRMNRAAGKPVPAAPRDVEEQQSFEEGVAPHAATLAQKSALFRDLGWNSPAREADGW